MTAHRGVGACACVALAGLFAGVAPAYTQSVRISGATTARYIEIRPFVRDSVPADSTDGAGLLRLAADGRVVRCVPDFAWCIDVRPGTRASTIPVIHDLEASVWGLGTGVRLLTHVRARTGLGGDAVLWPQGDDALHVLAAYGELERERFRLRIGRQWQVSGLGFYNFDGLGVAVRPARHLTLEGYAGRSLLRGLNENRSGGALESIEPLAPPSAGLLTGVFGRYRRGRVAIGTGYHVEFRTDGRGLYSELAMADAMVRVRGGSIAGSLELDVAGAALNEARVEVRSPPLGPITLHGTARRYRPYFELWTIWGAFSPVGFDEVRGGASWALDDRLIIRAEGSWRGYDGGDPFAGVAALRTDGWGINTNVSWLPAAAWHVDAAYRFEIGVGAARQDAHAGMTRLLGDIATVSVQGLAFQRAYEFRVDENTVAGVGAEASLRISSRARVLATAAAYRHFGAAEPAVMDWTQRRAMLRVQWSVGAEPGLAPAGGGAR
jgi:hypothetical protein